MQGILNSPVEKNCTSKFLELVHTQKNPSLSILSIYTRQECQNHGQQQPYGCLTASQGCNSAACVDTSQGNNQAILNQL